MNHFRVFYWFLGLLAAAVGVLPVHSQELAPDDPEISASLAAWFTDAENTFDPETGVWADSSGNDRHAAPVGEVNINGPVTYIAPTLSMISGGAFSDDEVASVHFANDADDLLVAKDLNGDLGLSDLTIFVVYNVDFLAATPNLTRPVGFGSVSGTQENPGDHFNLAGDPSIRKDNGQLGSGGYSQAFPNLTTFIRTARMSSASTAVDDWFNIDGTVEKVLDLTGVAYTTSVDDFFLGDLRAGLTSVPGFGTAISRADFDIVQVIAYTGALSDEQIAGVNGWLATHPGGGGGSSGAGFGITGIAVNEDRTSASLTWRSKPNRTYAIDLSYDLAAPWQELDDGVPSEGPETTASVPTFAGAEPDPLPARVFYRVRQLPN